MPTPAPDYGTLFNVEDAMDSACKAIIVAANIGPAFTPREVLDMPDSCIGIRTSIGMNYAERENAWSFTLTFSVWTDRSVDASSVSGGRVGAIRDLFRKVPVGQSTHPNFGEDVLPYHVINRLAHSGCDGQCSLPDDLDLREVNFEGVISVRPGCFPVVIDTP